VVELTIILAITLLVGTLAIGWFLTLLGLPGNWLIVAAAGAYSLWGPQMGAIHIGWQVVAGLALLAGIAELLELLAGMWGARRSGGTRRAGWYSLIGSIVGAIAGAIVGLPIPLFGSAIGAVFGAGLGAFAGAAWAEASQGSSTRQSWRVAEGAFWGRMLGTGLKVVFASMLCLVVLIALVM